MSERETTPLGADAVRAALESGAGAAPILPGAIAGQPTPFDVVGRQLVAARTMIAAAQGALDALAEQLDAATAALWLLTPPEARAALAESLAGSGARAQTSQGTQGNPADPTRPAEGSDTPRRPRTFMQDRGGNES
jgi:hypothetical protein